jgi:energy-coupling factor transporter ATP-binding protein EcfA2
VSTRGRQDEHVLRQLVFPARYEALVDTLGPQIAAVLVSPEQETHDLLEDAAMGLRARGEGMFLPIHAPSGTGKTTLANNLNVFLPGTFTPTLGFETTVDAESLRDAVASHLNRFPLNENKIVPINIDHREGSPPTDQELAGIKRFLRMTGTGSKSLVLWPDTSRTLANEMSRAYKAIAGSLPVEIPFQIGGPPRETWPEIAKTTLRLANGIDSLEMLGVDPDDYDPSAYPSIGEFLRSLSDDFTRLSLRLLRETRKPLRLVIVFASESADAGVLTHLTNSSRFGLLDGSALLDASPESEVGRWWSTRRGLLTQTIVRLDARAFGLPPSASIGLMRRYGPPELANYLDTIGVRKPGDSTVTRNIERSDVGKYLLGLSRATHETKGTPTTTSLAAFQYMANEGFTAGKDKALNKAMAEALRHYCEAKEIVGQVLAEHVLDFCPLIPDNAIVKDDDVLCFEYTWRGRDFLTAKHRGDIAKYCLTKLRNYSRELGWVAD